MSLRYRRMKPEDVSPCVQAVQNHPFIGPTYRADFTDLIASWNSLLRLDACCAVLFEEQLLSIA